jgi:hypothetical protein
MKKYIKKIAVFLSAALIFSTLTILANALIYSNTTIRSFYTYIPFGSYTSVQNTSEAKVDGSPMYISVNSSAPGNTYYARAMRCNAGTMENQVNCTMYNGRSVDHVTISRVTPYGIENNIVHGLHDELCVISLLSYSGYGYTSGWWAPDTDQEYATPSP